MSDPLSPEEARKRLTACARCDGTGKLDFPDEDLNVYGIPCRGCSGSGIDPDKAAALEVLIATTRAEERDRGATIATMVTLEPCRSPRHDHRFSGQCPDCATRDEWSRVIAERIRG